MLDKLYTKAVDELIGNEMPVWLIPKYEFNDSKTGKKISIDVDDWSSYCMFDESGDYICPTGFYLKTTYDGDEYFPEDFQVIFTKQQVKDKALEIANVDYPDVYNEMVNNLK